METEFAKLVQLEGHIEEADVAAVFDQAKPVQLDFMLGLWEGGSFNTGHPTHELLQTNSWAGKTFRSIDDVDPIVLYNEVGSRVWCKDYGNAQASSFLRRNCCKLTVSSCAQSVFVA